MHEWYAGFVVSVFAPMLSASRAVKMVCLVRVTETEEALVRYSGSSDTRVQSAPRPPCRYLAYPTMLRNTCSRNKSAKEDIGRVYCSSDDDVHSVVLSAKCQEVLSRLDVPLNLRI